MFLVSSDRELELYRKKLGEQEGACAPTSAATGSRVRSFSGKSIAFGDSIAMQNIEKVRSKQRSLLATTHSWIGAAVGALDGSYHHSSIGMALGSSAFRKDQTFPIGDALELILKWDGEDIDDDTNAKTLLDAVKAETKRLQRNQAHWEKVADSLRNSSALDTKESKMLAFSRAPVGAADEKEAKLMDAKPTGERKYGSGRLLVARLVPRHLIAGSSKPLNAAEESTLNTEIRLYAGTIVSLGRDITNDVQIRDAAASRRHGRIEVSSSGGQIYFVDLGSSNGTEIDGIQISAHGKMRLLSGTRVRIGDTYYICVENAAASQKRLLQSPGVVDQSGASGEKGAPVEKVDTGPREPDLSDLETFVRKLIAQGCGDYQSVRKSVGNRWGLSYFKSHRDFVRSILSRKKSPIKSQRCDSLPPADKVTDQSLLKTSTLASLSKVEVPPLKVNRKSLRSHSNDAVGALLADLGVGDVLL